MEHLKATTEEVQAEEYDVVSSPQKRDGEELISLIKQSAPKKAKRMILDLGCGTGTLTP